MESLAPRWHIENIKYVSFIDDDDDHIVVLDASALGLLLATA